MDFTAEFERLRLAILEYDTGLVSGPDPSDDMADLFEPLYQRLTVIQIFGSEVGYDAAVKAMAELTKWTSKGRKDHEALYKAYDYYVERDGTTSA